MKTLLSVLLILAGDTLFSQNCSCADEFRFIKNHIEKNHGGFNKKIKNPDEPNYKRFTDSLFKVIKDIKAEKYCIAYLKKYILYLQDHHSNITGKTAPPVNENDTMAVNVFLESSTFRQTETVPVNLPDIHDYLKKSADPIEGIYRTTDDTYEVAVMKNLPFRDYYGIIIRSGTRLWKTGQVKFELNRVNSTGFHYFGYLRNHSLTYEWLPNEGNNIRIPGWVKKSGPKPAPALITDNDLIRFTVLDSQTALLSIRSFRSSDYKKLDSAYKQVIPQIKKYPYLILDVRNNGGGADFSYAPLMPLLFTDTIYSDVVDIYNSPANISAYKKFDSLSVSSGNAAVFSRPLSKMTKAADYTFVPMGNGKPSASVYPSTRGNPVKIAILFNRGCASSCESLLFDAMYSRKTMFAGENSGGYTGYGNVMSIETPCGNLLSWTTTVYRDRWKYEFTGIPPHHAIPETETDWVDYTRRLVKQ